SRWVSSTAKELSHGGPALIESYVATELSSMAMKLSLGGDSVLSLCFSSNQRYKRKEPQTGGVQSRAMQRMDLTIPQGPRNRKAWPGLGRATARSVGSRVRSLGLTLGIYEGIALDLIQRYPNLAYTRDSDNDTAIIALAQTPCAWPSGIHLAFWQRWVYSCEYYMKY
ncbi:hypothetical protein F2Q69_00021086, partial [Brassica cretica]